jgi:hypothetical protein
MVFLCMYCDNNNPIALTVVDFDHQASGRYATGFFICPECNNKFIVKIQDAGKANNSNLFTSPSR